MAVMENPSMARGVLVPAMAPREGGKIRLPAPKNMENRVRPTSIRFRMDSLFIKNLLYDFCVKPDVFY